jgi:hypothetical protein
LDAFAALGHTFAKVLSNAESLSPDQWSMETEHDLAVLGWILPALSGRVQDDRLEDEVERLVALVRRGMPLGVEASVAQGFKLGASVNPTGARLHSLHELLNASRFWYSRIVLLQAIAVEAVSGSTQRRQALTVMRIKEKEQTEHPFVRAAASLCRKAVRHPRDWQRYVWDDESAVIRRSGSMLRNETAALLADIVLLLNVTEQGEGKARERRKEEAYLRGDLPYCLSASRERGELFDGCHPSCTFHLCPYPSTSERSLARGEFSQAFCRGRIDTLTGLSRIQALWRRRPVGGWSRSGRAALARFWAGMERRAA